MIEQSSEKTGELGSDRIYAVVINDEGQYSIWAKSKAPPAGWVEAGFQGSKDDCLVHIERVWTDMRPRSLQLQDGGSEVSAPNSSKPLLAMST